MAQVVTEGEPPPQFVRRARQVSITKTMARGRAYAAILDASARSVLGRVGTGRVYRYNGGFYRASAPGHPPAVRSGDLSRSGRVHLSGLRQWGQGWQVSITMEFGVNYARYLDPTLAGGAFAGAPRQREIRRFILQDAAPKFRRAQVATR